MPSRVGLLLAAVLLLGAGLFQLMQQRPFPAGSDDEPAAAGGLTLTLEDASEGAAPPDDELPPPAPPADEAPPTTSNAPLAERLAALVADPSLQGRTVGVAVLSADGTAVFSHRAEEQLLPASLQKLVVAAGAIATVGTDFRYETPLLATAAPGADGVLEGDLVLVGSGDPALGTPRYGELRFDRPRTPMEALADGVVAAGVTRITGSVYGDPRLFPHEPEAPGWLPRYFEKGDTSRSSGLTADGGRVLFYEGGRLRSEPAPDPAATAVASLHGLLLERGVVVDGSAGSTQAPPAAPVLIARVGSPPMTDLLRYMVQRSDNHLADAIFRTVGAAAGDASWAGSAAATQRALSVLDLDLAGTVLADGSGLSRGDRLSPAFLAALDRAMTSSNYGGHWQGLMAVAGESGTLQRRLVGTVADRRLRGKTGSLVDVNALSGVVAGPGSARYHFAVLGNDLDRAGQEALRRLQDHVVLALAEDLHDCHWLPVHPPPEDPAQPPAQPEERHLVCAA
ncbi:MAG TPA: D-alanyl-D-alanine carboxypeptidase/D-alanyl-D-alanine-endopeptidase [Egibacteraceae bacterium]|nr:D-alanyl-D-alanine carboxypeptidase/D-alanyl-D-alanine-endopeptidase [Egibacteraceae bacterium]